MTHRGRAMRSYVSTVQSRTEAANVAMADALLPDADLSQDKAELAAELRADLARAIAMRAATRQSAAEQADRGRLRAFQAARLAHTYADLLASPRYGPAAQFFLAELYGAKDRAERDETLSKVIPVLSRMLPAGAVRALAIAVRLDALSEELDLAMVRALREQGAIAAIDGAGYARAWQRCGLRPERERQIALIMLAGEVLDRLTRMTTVGLALRLMRGPAHAAGFGEVQDFLERGFQAFSHMGDAAQFLATIREREAALALRLYAGEAIDTG